MVEKIVLICKNILVLAWHQPTFSASDGPRPPQAWKPWRSLENWIMEVHRPATPCVTSSSWISRPFSWSRSTWSPSAASTEAWSPRRSLGRELWRRRSARQQELCFVKWWIGKRPGECEALRDFFAVSNICAKNRDVYASDIEFVRLIEYNLKWQKTIKKNIK